MLGCLWLPPPPWPIYFRSNSFSPSNRALAPVPLPFRSWSSPRILPPLTLCFVLQLSSVLRRPAGSLLPGAKTSDPTSLVRCSPAALQPALCTCLAPAQPPALVFPRTPGCCLLCSQTGYSSPAGAWHCPCPLPIPSSDREQSLERSEHQGAIRPGLGPEQLAFLQERKGGAQLCWVSKGLFLCSRSAGLAGFQAGEAVSQVPGCDWMDWSWLIARQASALLWARGMLFLGSLVLCPAQAFPLLPALLIPPQL